MYLDIPSFAHDIEDMENSLTCLDRSCPKTSDQHHQTMASSNRNNSHEEIWDDSALVDSWNDALEEYKVRESGKAQDVNRRKSDLEAEIP